MLTTANVDAPLEIVEIARFADGQSEWEISGGPFQRLLGRFDMDNSEARLYVHRILQRSGVLVQMQNAGVKYGDLVHLGELAFEFQE